MHLPSEWQSLFDSSTEDGPSNPVSVGVWECGSVGGSGHGRWLSEHVNIHTVKLIT